MHIGIVVWSLTFAKGGLERVGAELAGAMRARGHAVTVFCQDPTGKGQARYPLPEGVTVARFAADESRAGRDRLRALLTGRGLDVLAALFSWRDMLWFPAVLEGSGLPLLLSEHNHPDVINGQRWNRPEREAALSGADAIHILLRGFVPLFPECLRERITVIPNPVPEARELARPAGTDDAPRVLLAAGRLDDHHKRFSLLIEAFARLAPRFPGWELRIFGEGRDAGRYGELIKRHGLADRIRLMGVSDQLGREYARAHLFCIPSRYEGFGLVTAEAHRHGLPVVGFAGCTGTNEIVLPGENGLLAPEMTAESLADTLAVLLGDDALRERLGARAVATARRYDPGPIYDRWEALLVRTALAAGHTELDRRCRVAECDVLRGNLRAIMDRERIFDAGSGPGLLCRSRPGEPAPEVERLTRERDEAYRKMREMRRNFLEKLEKLEADLHRQERALQAFSQ